LRAKVRTVRLYYEVAVSKTRKHRLLPDHFLLVPLALDIGWTGIDRKRHLLFLYEENAVFNKTFKVVVKCAFGGRELILQTVHKVEPDDIVRYKRRCAKIRDHKFIEPGV
jgi:hypothetical protein